MILVWIFVAAAILFGLLGLSLYMLRPETEKTRSFAAFDHTMIAHRGLFDNHSEAPENSLAAFRKAVDQGFGIELDVQLTKDGKLVVFHDFDLKRMCGIHKKLTELTYAELEQYSLKDSTEKIPLFSAVLDLIAGRTPLVVEIKVGYDYKATTKLPQRCYLNTAVFTVWNALIRWHWSGIADIIQRYCGDNCRWISFTARIRCRRLCVFF